MKVIDDKGNEHDWDELCASMDITSTETVEDGMEIARDGKLYQIYKLVIHANITHPTIVSGVVLQIKIEDDTNQE